MLPLPQPTKIAWLAGLIDGDGCFSIGNGIARPTAVKLRIVLQEKDKFVLEHIRDLFGGRLTYRKINPNTWRDRCNNQWEWCLSRNRELHRLCKVLEPYLILKKQPCQQVIDILCDKCVEVI